MIRVLILLLVALTAGAAAAYYLRADTGYVQIAWRGWVLQCSLLGFALAAAAAMFALLYGARLLSAGLRLPSVLRGALDSRRRRRAQASFEEGLQHLLEGRWRQAELELIRRAADHPARGLNYLFAAQAAQQLGAADRAARYREQAQESLPVAAALARAQSALTLGDLPAARQLLLPLAAQMPQHERVVEQLAEIHARAEDWESLAHLLAAKPTAQALSAEHLREWQQRLARGKLGAALKEARLDRYKSVWEETPAPLRALPELRRVYVAGLVQLNAQAEATAQIESALRHDWDAELARRYGELEGVEPLTQLANAEQWLTQHGEKPELLRLAAHACRRNKLLGKARSYLEGLVRLAPSASNYLQLAQICAQMQAPDDAARYYREGLERTASLDAAG